MPRRICRRGLVPEGGGPGGDNVWIMSLTIQSHSGTSPLLHWGCVCCATVRSLAHTFAPTETGQIQSQKYGPLPGQNIPPRPVTRFSLYNRALITRSSFFRT